VKGMHTDIITKKSVLAEISK